MKCRFFYVVLLVLLSSQVYGIVDTLHIDAINRTYRINNVAHYYVDAAGQATLQDIRAQIQDDFKPLHGKDFRHGLSEAHIWFSLVLQSDLPQNEDFVLTFNDPSIYTIRLYQIQDGNIKVYITGLGIPPNKKALEGNKNSFEISVPQGKRQELFIEFFSKTSITISAELQAKNAYIINHNNEQVVFGIFYGIVLLLIIYGFLLFVTIRSKVFLFFSVYGLSVAGFTSVADGFMTQYLFWMIRLTNGYQDIFFFVVTNLLGLFFMKEFLNIRNWEEKYNRFINIYAIIFSGVVIGLFFISKPLMLEIAQLLGLITLVVSLAYGYLAYKKGVNQALNYLLAYIAFGTFITIFILSQFRVIGFSPLVQYAIHLGYALSMIILSYGLSQRINSVYQSLLIKEKEKKDLIAQKNRELEMKVKERTADIAQKEINLRSILDNNDNAIWLVDDQYNLIDFNVYFAESWKAAYGSTLKLGANILGLMPIDSLKQQWKKRYDVGLKGKKETYIDHFEFNGETHYYEIKGFPIEEGKTIKGVAFFSIDITQSLKAEKQLKTQNKMLKKANKELDSFVYSASHDLKAPLASVLGLINLVKTEHNLDTRLQYYEMMEKSVVRLDRFIKDIIDYSRNERTSIDYKIIDLEPIVEGVFSDLKYLNGSDSISKNIKIDGDVPLKTDPIRLRVAIRNLISNAIRYGCEEAVSNKVIDLTAEVNSKALILKVRDYGPGIPEEHLSNIFDMFYRAHEKSSGTGLGLYIVKETVDKLKGSIQVEAQMQPGAEFIVTIPNKYKA